MKKLFTIFALMIFVGVFGTMAQQPNPAPKNIIVLISDGWGYNHIDAANYYNGDDAATYQAWTHFAMSTYPAATDNVDDTIHLKDVSTGYNSAMAWSDNNFIKKGYTGSAPAATAMATGMKSAKYAIGVKVDSSELHSIVDRAYELNKRAGVVTSVQLSHATPASYAVHNISRNNYAEIARDYLIESKLSVVMGCGHPMYTSNGQVSSTVLTHKFVGGQETWEALVANDSALIEYPVAGTHGTTTVQDIDGDATPDAWKLITDSIDFVNLATDVNPPKRVFGVAKSITTLQQDRGATAFSGTYAGGIPDSIYNAIAYEIPFNPNVPNLSEMTMGALNVLSHNNNEGFFMMVEGGAIDWAGHGNSLGRIIEEQDDFNNMVDNVIAWVEANGGWEENIVIVTGDHETGYLVGPDYPENDTIVEDDKLITTYPIKDKGEGVMPEGKFLSGGHTNQLIPLYAKGAGSNLFAHYADEVDFVRGRYIDNTNIAQVCFDLWPLAAVDMPEVKNVMLFISDGWSYNHINVANYYMGTTPEYMSWKHIPMASYPGTVNRRAYDEGGMKFNSYNGWYNSSLSWDNWKNINRDNSDLSAGQGAVGSASAATSMYSGVKTAVKAVGVDAEGNPLPNIADRADEIGKSIGVVTSVQFAHATPASVVAHNTSRSNYTEIANEIILDSKAMVVMGCGHPYYTNDGELSDTVIADKYVGGIDTWNELVAGNTTFTNTSIHNNNEVQDIDADGIVDAWNLITEKTEFSDLASDKTPLRVMGVAQVKSTIQQSRATSGYKSTIPINDEFNTNVPSLEDMTAASLNVLDNNRNGFFLMVEGGAVDWAGHGNQLDRVIEEQVDFNNAVKAGMEWVAENDPNFENTLFIVTGDHETGYLVGENFDTTWFDNTNNMDKTVADLLANYNVVNKGTGNLPGAKFLSDDHTNQLIPLYVKGPGEEMFNQYADHFDFVRGDYMNNTEIAQIIFKLWKHMPAGTPDIDMDQVITTEVADVTEGGVNHVIYPNPSNGNFYLNVHSNSTDNYIIIYNVLGKIVEQQQLHNGINVIHIQDQPTGIYPVQITIDGVIENHKVMISN